MRLLACVLVVCAACGDSSSSAPDAGVTADANDASSADAAPTFGSCGVEHALLPPGSLGAVLEQDSLDTLTVAEANLARLALINEGVRWDRSVRHETQLHRIRYSTQDRGEAIEATGYVIAPVTDTAETFPVLLLMHGTTGVSDGCAPSRNLDDSDSENFALALVLSLIASNGYIVVAPDFIGLKASGTPSEELHPYLVGEVAAIGAWDAVRASADVIGGLDSTEAAMGPIAIWGASQGGHAAAFAARYAPLVAPELDVVAGVYNVPPLALEHHWQGALTSARESTGFMVMAFTAMADWYRTDLASVFVAPLDTQLPADLAQSCSPTTLDGVTMVSEIFTPSLLAANDELFLGDDVDPWSCVIRENSLDATSVPRTDTIPSLVITGEADTLVETAIERDAFARRCQTGDYDDWRYLECAGAGHTEGFSWAISDALDFIDDRVAGVPLGGACEVTAAVECQNTPL